MEIPVTDVEKNQIWEELYRQVKERSGKLPGERSRDDIMEATGLTKTQVRRMMDNLVRDGKCTSRISTTPRGQIVYYTMLETNQSS